MIAAEFFVKGRDAVIVRALISTISPSPRTSLPEYDIEFYDTDTSLFGGTTQYHDILRVMDGNNYETRKIVWDLDACVMLYDPALALKCTVYLNQIHGHRSYLEDPPNTA